MAALLVVAVTEGALIVARAQRSTEPIRVAAMQLWADDIKRIVDS